MRRAARGPALALWALAAATACRGPAPPSLLLVTLDTLRRDHVGAYGDARGLTPHLDALAAEGLVHDAAYTTMPTTSPAHVSLFTGLYPSEHGVRRNGDPLSGKLAGRELAARLRAAGYATAAFATTRLMSPAATGLRGFEVYDAPRGALRPGANAVEAALAWLDAERRRPVFLWVQLYDAHAPYGDADEKRRSFPVEPSVYGWIEGDRYAEPATRRAMEERYARGVRAADEALGALVEGVRRQLAAAPLVVAVADHGELLSEHLDTRGFGYDHGEFLDAASVAIPLVVAGPGVAPGRSPGTASIRDLYATLLAAAGIEPAAGGDARDLRTASDAARVVAVERRLFALGYGGHGDAVRAHAAAAARGDRLAIVGADDAPLDDSAPADLLRAARRHRARAARGDAPAGEIDPDTRRALRELGYAE